MNEFSRALIVDPIITETLFGSPSRNGPARAERELMAAVLSDAIECYWKYRKSRNRTGKKLYEEAEAWIFAEDEGQAFSFDNVCETLRLNPAYIRRGIVTWSERGIEAGDDGRDRHNTDEYRNLKRKLKSGREWKGSSRLSRQRVRPLRVQPR
jgi:hypothetical protein